MKLDVTSMFFAGFGLIQGYIIVASTLIAQKKSNCSKVESRDLTEVKHELASLKDIILNQNALIKERNISSLTVFRFFSFSTHVTRKSSQKKSSYRLLNHDVEVFI